MIKNEWLMLFRQRLFLLISLLGLVALYGVVHFSYLRQSKLILLNDEANAQMRSKWDNMEPTNPHGAAHFGTYLFKTGSSLQSLDEGVGAQTGNVIYLEGHVQNEMVYSEASQSLVVSKFGKLDASLIFQFILPLVLIFLAFYSFSAERDSGRLKILVLQGQNVRKVLLAKTFSIWLLGCLVLIFSLLLLWVLSSASLTQDLMIRSLLFVVSYAMYYLILVALTLLVSSRFEQATSSLAIMLSLWILWTIFLPKVVGNSTEKVFPLPSRNEFATAMKEDRSKGIDGHNPSDEREKELREKVFAEYGVDKEEDLPVNLDGIVMQADEEYGNMVWDKHFGGLYETYKKQKRLYQYSGIINPFISLQNNSMGFAQSDIFHHLDFLRQAEDYRRILIKRLNDEHAFGGSKTGNWSFKAETEFFRSIEDFEYLPFSLKDWLYSNWLNLVLQLVWSFGLLFLIMKSSKTVSIL